MHHSMLAAMTSVLLACVGNAHAVDVTRLKIRNAVDVCQGSLPNFEGALRKRPLAIANEGSAPSFLSCSLETNNEFNYNRISVKAIFVNRGSAVVTVNCTLVNGLLNRIASTFYPKSAAMQPGSEMVIEWTTSDSSDGFHFPNLNCSLPAGVEMGWISDAYPENVGA